MGAFLLDEFSRQRFDLRIVRLVENLLVVVVASLLGRERDVERLAPA